MMIWHFHFVSKLIHLDMCIENFHEERSVNIIKLVEMKRVPAAGAVSCLTALLTPLVRQGAGGLIQRVRWKLCLASLAGRERKRFLPGMSFFVLCVFGSQFKIITLCSQIHVPV